MLRRSAKHEVLALSGAGAAIHLFVVRYDDSTSRLGIVDTPATSRSNAYVGDNVVVVVVSGGGVDDGVSHKSADAPTARDARQAVTGGDLSTTKAAVDALRYIRLSIRRPDNLPGQRDVLRMVEQGNVAAGAGTVDDAACTRSASVAIFRAAIGGDPRGRRYNRRVDLVAGSNECVPQAAALQATAVQMPSGAHRRARCALLQHRQRKSHTSSDSSSRSSDAAAASPAASARDGELAATQKSQQTSKASETSFRQRDPSLNERIAFNFKCLKHYLRVFLISHRYYDMITISDS